MVPKVLLRYHPVVQCARLHNRGAIYGFTDCVRLRVPAKLEEMLETFTGQSSLGIAANHVEPSRSIERLTRSVTQPHTNSNLVR